MTRPLTTPAPFRDGDEWTRRRFVSTLAASLLAVGAVPSVARPSTGVDEQPMPLGPSTARRVIYLYMGGGMSHVDTFDPKPGAPTRGPFGAIATAADGVMVSEAFPLLAKQMDKVAVVRSLRTTQGAHAQGTYAMHTSYTLRGTIRHPSLGAWVERGLGRLHPSLPGHVVVGGSSLHGSAGFFPPRYLPLPIGEPSEGLQDAERAEHVDDLTWRRRLDKLEAMNAAFLSRWNHDRVLRRDEVFDQALALMSSADLAAFELEREPDAVRAAYGEGRFGQGCLLARRLVEHGVRFVEVVSDGWDMHSDLEDRLREECPPVDRAVAALLADLDARGLLEDTLVVLATEFGRTPSVRVDRGGRDHFPAAFSGLLAGGGIAGGRAWGATDERGERIVADPVDVADFNATIAYALGLSLEHRVVSPEGRPFTVADTGRPVTGLFG